MSEAEQVPAEPEQVPAEPEWVRRRRRAEVFGDPLPETTRDERGDGDPEAERDGDAWLRAQVPPHHGG